MSMFFTRSRTPFPTMATVLKRSISNIIYFKNIPRFVTNQMLGRLAVEYGEFTYAGIVTPGGQNKNIRKEQMGVVEFKNSLAAQAMMDELQNAVLFSKRITLEYGSFSNKRRHGQHSSTNKKNNNNSNNSNSGKVGSSRQINSTADK